VAVELDSRAFHDISWAFESDRERDRGLQAAGWRPIRVTWRQLERSRAGLERDLRRMLGLAAVTLAS
jgi:very-short-patch-repair endonuclease